MAANEQIVQYIREQLKDGVSKESIMSDLLTRGWPKRNIDEAFAFIEEETQKLTKEAIPSKSRSVGRDSILKILRDKAETKFLKRKTLILGIILILFAVSGAVYLAITPSLPPFLEKIVQKRSDLLEPTIGGGVEVLEEEVASSPLLSEEPYFNEDFRIIIHPPKGWSVFEGGGSIVSFVKNDESGSIPPSLFITFKRKKGASVEDIASTEKKFLLNTFDSFKIIDERRVSIRDKAARLLEGTFLIGEEEFRVMEIVFPSQNLFYLISVTSPVSSWDLYKEEFLKSIATFEAL